MKFLFHCTSSRLDFSDDTATVAPDEGQKLKSNGHANIYDNAFTSSVPVRKKIEATSQDENQLFNCNRFILQF